MEPGTHPDPLRGGAQQREAKDKAKELTRTARERALSTLDQQKAQLSGLLERVADSTQDDRLGGYASEYARRGAEFLRRQSADEIYRSVVRGARSRPAVLLSACFVAGLAFARLMKGASGDRSDERGRFGEDPYEPMRDEPWRGELR